MTYEELRDALGILGLNDRASLRQIKQRHRQLVKRYHPDQGRESGEGDIRRINAAYQLVTSYCANYRYCFSEQEFLEQTPQERLRRQFGNDPLWSSGDGENTTD